MKTIRSDFETPVPFLKKQEVGQEKLVESRSKQLNNLIKYYSLDFSLSTTAYFKALFSDSKSSVTYDY